jgi:hypothetical protein
MVGWTCGKDRCYLTSIFAINTDQLTLSCEIRQPAMGNCSILTGHLVPLQWRNVGGYVTGVGVEYRNYVVLCGSPGVRTAKPVVRKEEEWILKLGAAGSLETSSSNMLKKR